MQLGGVNGDWGVASGTSITSILSAWNGTQGGSAVSAPRHGPITGHQSTSLASESQPGYLQ